MIRRIAPTARLDTEAVVAGLPHLLPPSTLQAALAATGVQTQRVRKLPAEVTLVLTVAMNWYPHLALDQVLRTLLKGLRLLWPGADADLGLASKSAVCQARARLGARPVVDLFHRVCRPLATPTTPGAFHFGLRLVALDGTVEDVPDTAANDRVFGRGANQHQPTAFPQLRAIYLSECGTHAILDAGVWPIRTSEHVGARRLVRSVRAGMLLLWDSGLHSHALAAQTRAQGAHFLGRVPSGVLLTPDTRLADGSALAWWVPADRGAGRRQRQAQALRVRVVTYTLTDPARPGYQERHRLVTSLLDVDLAPALEVVMAYHERWEVELVIDEVDTHLRQLQAPWRSQTPVGVIQELYGALLAHYAVRKVMVDAAAEADLDPRRLSFLQTVRLVCDALPEFQQVTPAQHPRLYARLLADVRRYRLPPRANRTNPRVTKRLRTRFPPKRACHRHPPKLTRPFREVVQLLI